jgi:hypothetical protein
MMKIDIWIGIKRDIEIMIKKFFHIIRGWGLAFGIIQKTKAEEALSHLRLKICARCEKAKESKVLGIINGQAMYERSIICSKCSCPCLEKSLVIDEKCPIGKW